MSDIEHKFLRLDVKASDDGTIEGYGSVSGNVDRGGDVVIAGAFAESLERMGMPKMLWQHDMREVIGVWDEASEDERGLRLKGRFALSTQKGREAHELVKMGALNGLSIGYSVRDDVMEDGARNIKAADLFEVSVVTIPMNEQARIDAVKAAEMTQRDFEKRLTQDAGFSRTVARALMSGGIEAVKGMQAAADDERELRELLKARVFNQS
jgi:hypothetical protein